MVYFLDNTIITFLFKAAAVAVASGTMSCRHSETIARWGQEWLLWYAVKNALRVVFGGRWTIEPTLKRV